ncbi:glyoxalase [Luteimonas chenhongjianii]|uniref:Glyoxalase n=1 Tax=Luteimonas chenhongjianii TaxID=2006110 RepID=A0A290XFB1_9GAMM|nr:VOC family protein [Luteimonas chenhongjianii]ATD67751.1 glyoxalase [Luteimonas chenhongjianii]
MDLLVNLDVPDLARAEALYTHAFGLSVGRRFGTAATELCGLPARLYLLHKPAGSIGAGNAPRDYSRHWCPVHLDVVVADLDTALARAERARFAREGEVGDESFGRIVQLADPFGHGWCLLEFGDRGYDAIATATGAGATAAGQTGP